MDKGLDGLLLASIITGIILITIELLFSLAPETLSLIHRIDALLIGVFFVDSTRTFFKCRSVGDYIKHHWLDLVLLVVIIISFSAVLFTGMGRLRWLVKEERVFTGLGKYVSLSFMRKVQLMENHPFLCQRSPQYHSLFG